jgi:hypothetical protein
MGLEPGWLQNRGWGGGAWGLCTESVRTPISCPDTVQPPRRSLSSDLPAAAARGGAVARFGHLALPNLSELLRGKYGPFDVAACVI